MTVRSRICLQHIPTYLSAPDDGRVIGDFATAGCTLSSSELTNGPHQSSAKRYQEPGSDVPGPKVPFFALNIIDRKSTRLNSSHVATSYAVFCSKKKSMPIRKMVPMQEPNSSTT